MLYITKILFEFIFSVFFAFSLMGSESRKVHGRCNAFCLYFFGRDYYNTKLQR